MEREALIGVRVTEAVCRVEEGNDGCGVGGGDHGGLPAFAAALMARIAWPQGAANEHAAVEGVSCTPAETLTILARALRPISASRSVH